MCAGRRGGQALLIAVLLMMAILLVGILFVAIVTYNQSSSARHEDMLLGQALAEAGIRYADEMLCNSPQGADWRPPDPPAQYTSGAVDPGFWGEDGTEGTEDDYYTEMEIARGWAPLWDDTAPLDDPTQRRGFTRYPDPRQPGSTSAVVNNFTLGRGHFLLRVTYDPDPPYELNDPTPHVPDPMSCHIKIESIGRVEEGAQVFRKLVAYKPVPLLNYLRYVTDVTNTGKPAQLGFAPFIDMDSNGSPEWLPCVYDGPIKVNSALEIAGAPPAAATNVASAQFNLTTGGVSANGYLRDDTLQVASGIGLLDVNLPSNTPVGNVPWVAQVSLDANPPQKLLWSGHESFSTLGGPVTDGQEAVDGSGDSRFNSPLGPPSLTVSAEVTGADRYRELTRDSGEVVTDPLTGSYVNNGEWGHGQGVYVDNVDDVQYTDPTAGQHDRHDIEALIDDWQRPQSASGMRPADSGWNALYTTYSPPGVEIELLPSDDPGASISTSAPAPAGSVWWPDYDAANPQPGIKLTRHDETWRQADGSDSGEHVMVVSYPDVPNQVIFAEGNVRVRGQLPPAARDAGTSRLLRSYDLTIVSNATIYIDGQILSPQNLDQNVIDASNTKVALLARDCVCLNTTQIVPQLTTGLVSAAPDDPLNPDDRQQHWELAPGSDGRAYSTWRFGTFMNPVHANNQPATANLVVRQTAADPGPSGVGLMIWDGAGAYQPYDFGNPVDPGTFLFALPGVELYAPSGVYSPQSYCSSAIAPNWEQLWAPVPTVPWNIGAYVDTGVGVNNRLVLLHRDPRFANSTDYWVKRWKIEELNSAGDVVGGIRACVNATVYAERGCWYVLSSGYFDDKASGADAVRFRRYNYRIAFKGQIAENFTARLEAVRDWTDKTAYPAYDLAAGAFYWGTVEYIFDEAARIARDQALSDTEVLASVQSNQPKLPLLPVSPDLVYYGEAH
jgi:hypothetical protein